MIIIFIPLWLVLLVFLILYPKVFGFIIALAVIVLGFVGLPLLIVSAFESIGGVSWSFYYNSSFMMLLGTFLTILVAWNIILCFQCPKKYIPILIAFLTTIIFLGLFKNGILQNEKLDMIQKSENEKVELKRIENERIDNENYIFKIKERRRIENEKIDKFKEEFKRDAELKRQKEIQLKLELSLIDAEKIENEKLEIKRLTDEKDKNDLKIFKELMIVEFKKSKKMEIFKIFNVSDVIKSERYNDFYRIQFEVGGISMSNVKNVWRFYSWEDVPMFDIKSSFEPVILKLLR